MYSGTAACLESRGSRVRLPLWRSVLKETMFFQPVSYFSRSQTARVCISSPVSGGKCHLTILRRFSWPNSAYIIYAEKWPKTPFVYSFYKSL